MKYLLILLIFASCGTRKTDTIKRDSISINNTYKQGEKIVFGNTFTYKPYDSLKPMVIEGKEYNNVIITNDKSKTVTKWKDRFITKTKVVTKHKTTEKTDYTILIIGLSAVLLIGAIVFFGFRE